jgi:hypothetical protein
MNLKTTAVTYLILLKFLPLNKYNIPRMLKDKIISRDQRFPTVPTQFLGSEVGTVYFQFC